MRRTGFLFLLAALAACERPASLPEPGDRAFRQVVSAFYAGLAAMEVSADAHAEEELLRVTELAPGEPAAWANLGLLALRRNELDLAASRLERARALAPENSSVQVLLAVLASQRGQGEGARDHLRRAIALDSTNVRAMFALADQLERGDDDDQAAAQSWLERILEREPDNQVVLVELSRLAAKRDDLDGLGTNIARLEEHAEGWPAEAHEQLDSVRTALEASDLQRVARRLTFLRNVLLQTERFRADLTVAQSSTERLGEPLEMFVRLPRPDPRPAPADDSLIFAMEPLTAAGATWGWVGAIDLGDGGGVRALMTSGRQLVLDTVLPFPGGESGRTPGPAAVLPADYDNDFRTDLALAGGGGLRLYRQERDGAFTDATSTLPPGVSDLPLSGAWAFDVDLEGDLDILLSDGARVLRNNGDGSFDVVDPFGAPGDIVDFVWVDFDGDGDPDVALIDRDRRLHILENGRQGRYTEDSSVDAATDVAAIAAGDVDRNGTVDLLTLATDGRIRRLSRDGDGWTVDELARWLEMTDGNARSVARLLIADLDNNGASDVIASWDDRTRVWLQDSRGLRPLGEGIELQTFDVADLDADGRLELIGLAQGRPVKAKTRGSASYHWVALRPRAVERAGDQRINSHGLGGVVELRSGLLYQLQPITRPALHFGLGAQRGANVARIVWPNGLVQAEFDLQAGETLRAQQRLKGSCPWVFTYDGSGMRFVTDFLWRSPLGMRINAQETAGIATTADWIKIRGDELSPRGGYYDVRITAELWETHFFDAVSLRVVDHPPGTEIFVDERFAVPPPEPTVRVTGPVRSVARAWDERGREVGTLIESRDERYLDTFELGVYQGVAHDHYVELDLGRDVPTEGPVWLVASGWVRPTDSSINVALSQGTSPRPTGLQIELPDANGGWRVARDELGFPAGKSKTVLIDLSSITEDGIPRRLRLRTNLEVYWDRIGWARGLPEAEHTIRDLSAETAELRYRGFSHTHRAGPSSPEYPDYDRLAGTAPRWRDLSGYYTRYGDVRSLLAEADDRYVIMNAGDELVIGFRAPEQARRDWRRDYVLLGDGWVKDGDYNTEASATVRPLPGHDSPEYVGPAMALHEDAIYRRHADDWRVYHTRWVDPTGFRTALIPGVVDR